MRLLQWAWSWTTSSRWGELRQITREPRPLDGTLGYSQGAMLAAQLIIRYLAEDPFSTVHVLLLRARHVHQRPPCMMPLPPPPEGGNSGRLPARGVQGSRAPVQYVQAQRDEQQDFVAAAEADQWVERCVVYLIAREHWCVVGYFLFWLAECLQAQVVTDRR